MADLIRILVADDHPVVRDGLAAMLDTQPDFQVVAQASTGVEAVQKAVDLKPDILLLDLEMPDMDGVEALKQLRLLLPEIRTLVFTAFKTDELILGAIRAGAKGYLLKGAPRDQLFFAIRVISQGGSLLEPVVASKLIEQMGRPAESETTGQPALTNREMEVLRLLAQGKANREIAGELVISERTVKFHVSSIMSKLGAGNRTEAVSVAAQRGLIDL
jgi:two-component system, NarL family, response regulator LiaR